MLQVQNQIMEQRDIWPTTKEFSSLTTALLLQRFGMRIAFFLYASVYFVSTFSYLF